MNIINELPLSVIFLCMIHRILYKFCAIIYTFCYNTPVIKIESFFHLAVDTNPGEKQGCLRSSNVQLMFLYNFTFSHN